jgi:predicted GH43/DUF377 family glycosyl hydrolase
MKVSFEDIVHSIVRLDVPIKPNGDILESEGVLNPASAIDRQGNLLLYPRVVAPGNESRVGIMRAVEKAGKLEIQRLGYALVPQEECELGGALGQGCEDPRAVYIDDIDRYVMTYTAYGAQGPRIAVAISNDGYDWKRLGLVQFPTDQGDNKDASFFPEPVRSPNGVLSLAMEHRPMTVAPEDELNSIDSVLSQPAEQRPGIYMAYVALEAVKKDLSNITKFSESLQVMSPGGDWGLVKIGGGTPPVRIKEGWLSIFHGVDAVPTATGTDTMRYSAGILIRDAEFPHRIVYRSLKPLFVPETREELKGTVNNVVFPTSLVSRGDIGPRVFDIYYGMADYCIGRIRLTLT